MAGALVRSSRKRNRIGHEEVTKVAYFSTTRKADPAVTYGFTELESRPIVTRHRVALPIGPLRSVKIVREKASDFL